MEDNAAREMPHDREAMMEVYRKLGTPGAHHKVLERMAGSWETHSKCWMEPGEPPGESTGSVEHTMILGGRFMKQEVSGDGMMGPYNGFGTLGYDNHARKYVSTWMDNMSTGMMHLEGTGGGDGNVVAVEGSYDDLVMGPTNYRIVYTVLDDSHLTFEMFRSIGGRNEMKMMEMTFTRKE